MPSACRKVRQRQTRQTARESRLVVGVHHPVLAARDHHHPRRRGQDHPVVGMGLPAADVSAMQALDPSPYDLASYEKTIQLELDVMVFASASDYTRAAILKVGGREDDATFGRRLPD